MLIELDNTLLEILDESSGKLDESSLEVNALNNLAIAYRNGWHIVIGSLKVLKLIKNLSCLDSSTKRVFEKILNEYTFQKSYKDIAGEYILVGMEPELEVVSNDTNIVYRVPLNYFSSLSRCFASTLLCEDERDFDFYMKFVQKYIAENKQISKVGINFSFANGGGANSYKVFQRNINQNGNPLLAVADTDLKYPNSKIGQTLDKLIKVKRIYEQTNIIDVYPIRVRAKENLLPPSLYVIGTNSSSKSYFENLLALENQESLREKLLYFNIKDGYKVKHFRDKEFIDYFSDIFEEIKGLISCSIEEISKKEDNEEVIINGLNGIIDQFIYYIFDGGIEKELEKKKSLETPHPKISEIINELEDIIERKNNLFEHIPDYMSEIICTLCHKIISWGCCKDEFFAT